MSVLLDTRQLKPGERSEALHSVLTAATAAHDLRLLGAPAKVHARLEHWQLSPDVALLRQASSGVSHTRTERHQRHDGPERVVFVLHGGAPGSYLHDGSARRLAPGGLYVTDLNSCYSYTRPGHGVARIVQVERSALGLTMEQVQEGSARVPTSPFYDLLRNHITHLARVAPALPRTVVEPLAAATADLAGTLLSAALRPEQAPAQTGALVGRSIRYLQRHYSCPELTAQQVAGAHGVSVRYLFQQWATQPRSMSRTLLEIRLDAARDLLVAEPHLPVDVVAHRCGFADRSHFSRRFTEHQGIGPKGYRALAVGGSSTTEPPLGERA